MQKFMDGVKPYEAGITSGMIESVSRPEIILGIGSDMFCIIVVVERRGYV
jgi:ribulose kinase